MKNIKIKDTEFNLKNTLIGLFSGFVNGLFGSGGGILLGKKIPNNFFKSAALIWVESKDPNIAPSIPNKAIGTTSFIITFLFLI